MPRDREPWFKVKIGIRRSGKMAALPSDSARLGYFYMLAEAKVQRRMGVFESRGHFAEVLGRFGRWLPDYLAVGMVHEAPIGCEDCRSRHGDVRPGQLVIHDYLREQRDPTHADRQAGYRGRVRDGDSDAIGTDDSVTNGVTHDEVRDAERDGIGTPYSRARGTTATATGTTTTREGLTRPSTEEGARAEGLADPSDEKELVPWT